MSRIYIYTNDTNEIVGVSEKPVLTFDFPVQAHEYAGEPPVPHQIYDFVNGAPVVNQARQVAHEQQKIQRTLDDYSDAAQQRINAELAARDYDNEAQLATYATTANPYQVEAKALQDWITGTVWPAWEALDPTALDPKGAKAWADALPSPQL